MKKLMMAAGGGTLLGLVVTTQIAGPLVAQEAASNGSVYEQLDLFGDIFERIRAGYVEDVNEKDLIEAAINGMLTSLDPHSSYLSADDADAMRVQTRGEFGGLGIEVTLEGGVIRVISPMDGTPADRAGIKSGDLIIRLDGMVVKGESLDKAVDKMRGAPGSEITLTISREGVDAPFDITLKRAIIQLRSVRAEMLESNYGYARISQFQSGTGASLRQQIEKLQEQSGGQLAGLVLDLRNNPGGVLNGAVEVSDLFLKDGVIVSTRGRAADAIYTFEATGRDVLDGAPLVVLVNRGSASASEIVAGALQDHRRALILGTKTFGKGSVQTILPMNDGAAALKLTTARYYTPNNRSIQATGIEPDIVSRPLKLADDLQTVGMRESDLAGHLANESGIAEGSGDSAESSEKQLQDRDLEVGEALNILKGITFSRLQVD